MEKRLPLDLRVALDERRLGHPLGALRFVALLVLALEGLVRWSWLPIPSWCFTATLALVVALPLGRPLARFLPFSGVLTFPGELEDEVVRRATLCYEDAGIGSTKGRNGVLVFFVPASRRFHVLPDPALASRCGSETWNKVTERMRTSLAQGGTASLGIAILSFLDELEMALQPHLPENSAQMEGELPNAVLFLS